MTLNGLTQIYMYSASSHSQLSLSLLSLFLRPYFCPFYLPSSSCHEDYAWKDFLSLLWLNSPHSFFRSQVNDHIFREVFWDFPAYFKHHYYMLLEKYLFEGKFEGKVSYLIFKFIFYWCDLLFVHLHETVNPMRAELCWVVIITVC